LRHFAFVLRAFSLPAFLLLPLLAQDMRHQPEGSQIAGPGQPSGDRDQDFPSWLADLKQWRRERLIRMGYSDAEYRRPELQWAQHNFIQPQMMVEERGFYDPVAGQYTVDRYLDDLDKRYGGIDSVLIWPVYPNIGIDNRNQWDLHRDMPGGIPALRRMVEDFHRRGVKVFFPAMPWDTGTRDIGVPYWTATAQLMAETGADGVNGDTFAGLPRAYRTASDETGHPVVFEPEGSPQSDEGLMWNNQSWGNFRSAFAPPVSKLKWLERRHMINISDRWARDKTDDLQFAFFNGIGYESWENIWGIWNQITQRDAEGLRRVATIERKFADLLVSPDWEPHTPVLQYGVFASKFPGDGKALWTLINRNEYDVRGGQMRIPHKAGTKYYDVWHGTELSPDVQGPDAVLSFPMESNGFGAILALDQGASSAGLEPTLRQMKEWARVPLALLSHEWHFLPQHMVENAPAKPSVSAPAGMILIPAADYDFHVTGVEIEGFNWIGLDVQYPWEDSPRRGHQHSLSIRSFYIDKYPVTNAEFKKFLDASHYRPKDDHNFLRDWKAGSPPAGWENKPVIWVSLEDARAFAAWAGKRLPHEWEWQYAAQGTDGRLYPWGNTWNDNAVPQPYKGRDLPGPSEVNAHPAGASPFGAMDMVANVWQWTDEYVDEHTRAAIVRGGSYYQPQGSHWYFPQAYKLTEHGKYLLMAPSKDRSGALGFRCVTDTQ